MKSCLNLALVIVLAALISGCASTPEVGTIGNITVHYQNSNTVFINGSKYSLSAMNAALRSCGAGKNTAIAVSVPEKFGEKQMSLFFKELAKGGFTRVFFTEPRRILATPGSFKSKSSK